VLTVAVPEAELTGHILVAVLEDQNGCLVNLDCKLLVPVLGNSMVDVRLLASGDAAVDLLYQAAI